ncbi:hypothetical protein [Muricoccus pecuniae]|uniref:DNA-binding protein n=1 Tax=Muricoccus pecuniae TaxID=693023 RepID=A0A840XXQ7_9PROT|nr:hypothetical protein [Roseomonas pecuniae]MBB5693578.1 hypothetical protein [Roseomonas pecuniae]
MSYGPPPDTTEYESALETRAGGNLSVEDVGHLLGITRQEVDERRRERSLLAIHHEDGWVYPRAQFVGSATVPCLALVVEGLETCGPWVTLEFLVTPDDALGGLSPKEALLRGGEMRDRVQSLVRGWSEGEGFA